MAQFEYLHRIDPNITLDGAQRILAAAERDLPRLRPKAKAATMLKIEMIKRDIAKIG